MHSLIAIRGCLPAFLSRDAWPDSHHGRVAYVANERRGLGPCQSASIGDQVSACVHASSEASAIAIRPCVVPPVPGSPTPPGSLTHDLSLDPVELGDPTRALRDGRRGIPPYMTDRL